VYAHETAAVSLRRAGFVCAGLCDGLDIEPPCGRSLPCIGLWRVCVEYLMASHNPCAPWLEGVRGGHLSVRRTWRKATPVTFANGNVTPAKFLDVRRVVWKGLSRAESKGWSRQGRIR
jgi:hypothetical protein